MSDALVWYVAYGSNLAAHRLRIYLEGGTPEGALRRYEGCRDPSPPRDSLPLRLAFPLFFAGRSRTWDGGVAFVDPVPRPDVETLARRWLVTASQLEDIVAQERGAPRETIDVAAVVRDGVAVLGGGGRYGTLVLTDTIRAVPSVTCTSPLPGPERPVAAAPAPAYLRTIARGLAEAHGAGPAQAARYLAAAPGVREAWAPAELEELLTRRAVP